MKRKDCKEWKELIEKASLSLIVIGFIILVIGIYYVVVKAGIPYQDPTEYLLLKYESYTYTGKVLFCVVSHWYNWEYYFANI